MSAQRDALALTTLFTFRRSVELVTSFLVRSPMASGPPTRATAVTAREVPPHATGGTFPVGNLVDRAGVF